ncbi:hypothetical protein OPV22_021707 [Ensete ventricosum]|uniref:JAB1/MPN/MOV34 metalloenzyme domain-containing protein n=1 Tax=Ensete ventricosum TaxID=4639 RepID=A0AAV8PBD5_ENSVE|nr:hypothetical protein OPV22_021707 [Ensete ventricosum]
MSLLLLTKPISVSCFARDTTSHSRSPRRPPPRRCTTSTIVPSAARSAASAAKPSSSILSSLAIYGCRTSLSVTDHWRNSHSPAIPATVANRAVAFLLCHLIAAAAAPPFPPRPSGRRGNGVGVGVGLTVKLHPLLIVNISDHHTSVKSQTHHSAFGAALADGSSGAAPSPAPPRVFGCVIGVQRGRTVEIFNSFELLYDPVTNSLDRSFLEKKQELCNRTPSPLSLCSPPSISLLKLS